MSLLAALAGARVVPRRLATVVALAAIELFSAVAQAGPVEVYREGPRFCPRDRAADAPRLTQAQAVDRARRMLPADFCGRTAFVAGCDVQTEYALDSWRVYFHQYHVRDGAHDWGGLTHTYVILDPVGNCFANIPGTEFGAPR